MTEHWATLAAVGAVTFLFRFSCLGLFGVTEIHPRWSSALRFVPPAAFAALIAPELLGGGTAVTAAVNPRLAAGALAALVAWKTRSVPLTIAGGMAALHALTRL
jgi:branched-subunit amino acid transport protein